ncbi:hypothetical protein ACHMW6_25385 [Pseudoduganella sp. UC29_106]|uniref:hypothetical protein n=1 Tax=Pseudoduganella sp. UC29_106 TaxID=3374553 RepID=UPI00375755A8
MKTSILFAAIVACALSAPIVSAQEKTVPVTSSMGMNKQMQENMKEMQHQMEKFQATTDPKERQKLMQEHMQSMQESMKEMHGMGGSMMSSDQHGGVTKGDHKNMAKGDMMKHHDMMEKRMDMMQMMMEQMVQHQKAQETTRQ